MYNNYDFSLLYYVFILLDNRICIESIFEIDVFDINRNSINQYNSSESLYSIVAIRKNI